MRVDCQRLFLEYPTDNGTISALEDVSLTVREHEFVCVVGPSGCGKTTLLKMIAGLLRPTSGRVVFEGVESDGRPHNVLVFQEHALFPWMSVLDNVAFGLEVRGIDRATRHSEARTFVDQFGLSQFARCYPHELSVGMRQRAGLARAFVTGPQMLLMDEPFASLDALTKVILQEELLRIWSEQKQLVVYVTHDIEEALLLGDRVLVMTGRPGRIREEVEVPLARPRNLLDRGRPEIAELKKHVWRILEEEVRVSLDAAR